MHLEGWAGPGGRGFTGALEGILCQPQRSREAASDLHGWQILAHHVENGLSGETGFRETGEEDILILPAKTDDRRWGLPEDQWGKREKEARDSGSPGPSS